jgi:hypothetical protein
VHAESDGSDKQALGARSARAGRKSRFAWLALAATALTMLPLVALVLPLGEEGLLTHSQKRNYGLDGCRDVWPPSG